MLQGTGNERLYAGCYLWLLVCLLPFDEDYLSCCCENTGMFVCGIAGMFVWLHKRRWRSWQPGRLRCQFGLDEEVSMQVFLDGPSLAHFIMRTTCS